MMLFFSIYLLLLVSRGTLRRNLRFDCFAFGFLSPLRRTDTTCGYEVTSALPARLRLLVSFHSVPAFHLSPPTAGLFFSLAKSRQKEKLKTKNFENENVFEGFQIARNKSQIKIKIKIAR